MSQESFNARFKNKRENKRAHERKMGYGFKRTSTNNRNAERRQDEKRREEYRAARENATSWEKGQLSRKYHADKRARRQDRIAEHNLRFNAWRRKHGEKKYNRDKGTDQYNPSDHKDFLDGTGVYQQKNIDAYNDYRDNYRKYKQNPGSLSAKYERKTPGLKGHQRIF